MADLVGELLEFTRIRGEEADTLGEFFGGHGVFVELPAEAGLVEADLRDLHVERSFGVQLARDIAIGRGELAEQGGRDGEVVAAGQLEDLVEVAEARAHDEGVVAVAFVVVVDACDGLHARILVGRIAGDVVGVLVPVEDAPDERRDECDTCVGAGDGLGEAEQEG